MMRCQETAAKMIAHELETYRSHKERSALRCALSDAAHLCDALAKRVRDDGLGRGGVVKKEAQKIAEWIEIAGNEIWAMRDQVTMPTDTAGTGG